MLAWGAWALLADLATRNLAPAVAMVVSYVAGAALVAGYVLLGSSGVDLPPRGVGLAVLAGVASAVGVVAFYTGLEAGRASIVTTVSALYFVVAGVLGVLVLGESVSGRELLAVGFAVAAVVLIAH
jgi:uncharacterized membrane protein